MRFNEWKISVLVIILAFLAAFLIPGFGPASEIGIIPTVTGLLFGILTGFILGDRNKRYSDLKSSMSTEAGVLSYIYMLSGIIDKKFQDSYRDFLDNYLVSLFDYKVPDYELTSNTFNKLFDPLKKIIVKSDIAKKSVEELEKSLGEITKIRSNIIVQTKDRLNKIELFTLVILDCIIIFSLFFSKTTTIASSITVAMLTAASIIILIFLWAVDSLSWKFEIWSVEPYQRVFDTIGKPRYYPYPPVKKGLMHPRETEPYRLAFYEDGAYPKIIKRVKIINKGKNNSK